MELRQPTVNMHAYGASVLVMKDMIPPSNGLLLTSPREQGQLQKLKNPNQDGWVAAGLLSSSLFQ